jgi:predicted TIM-barrel fold metal-dependent hydrolase
MTFLEGSLQDPFCDALVKEMDEAGIAKAVLQVPDFTYALRDSSTTIEELIEHHRTVQARHPGRFSVMAGVDPRWGSDGVALFERGIVDYDFDGLKLYPPCGYSLSDKELWPYYEICSAYSLPVLTHIGSTSPVFDCTDARPIFIERPALAFPRVNFVLAHGNLHYPDECQMLCSNRPNVYLDVSGFEAVDISQLTQLFRRRITHKTLFGTDWPIFRLQGRQVDFVNRINNEGAFPDSLTALDRQLFYCGNAARLLNKNTRRPAAEASSQQPPPQAQTTQ